MVSELADESGEKTRWFGFIEVSCVQYRPFGNRTKDEAERIAILKVRKLLKKRGFESGIVQFALAHRNSGHIHVTVVSDIDDEELICYCCKEAQKPILRNGERPARVCNCGDCAACDKGIRMDLEQLTRS